MDRIRFTESAIGLLLLLIACPCFGQQLTPRESSDPYFNSKKSSTTEDSRLASRLRESKIPQVDRPAGTFSKQGTPQSDFAKESGYPLQPSANQKNFQTGNDFQLRSGSSNGQSRNELNGQNDFRPPGIRNKSLERLQSEPLQPKTGEPIPRGERRDRTFAFKQSANQSTVQQPVRTAMARPQESEIAVRTSTSQPSNTRQQDGNEFEPGRVVAIVGGHPIFVGDMLFEANQLLDRFMPGAPEKIKAEQRGAVVKKLIPKFIDAKLLLIDTIDSLPPEADFDKVVESAETEFDEKALPRLIEQSGVASALELDAQLRAQGGSLRQMRYKWAEEQIIKFFIGKKLQVDTQISHREMLDAYQKDREKFHQKARVRWEELAVRFERVPNRLEAQKQIKQMGNEVVYGAPLDAVAKRSSQGFTASDGGQHDWTSKGALVYKDVEKALFSIPVNQLSDVIESKDGYHIVRVIERTEESYTPFLEAQVAIRQQLENEKRNQAFEDHLKKLRKRIPFEVQLEDVQLPAHLAEINGNLK